MWGSSRGCKEGGDGYGDCELDVALVVEQHQLVVFHHSCKKAFEFYRWKENCMRCVPFKERFCGSPFLGRELKHSAYTETESHTLRQQCLCVALYTADMRIVMDLVMAMGHRYPPQTLRILFPLRSIWSLSEQYHSVSEHSVSCRAIAFFVPPTHPYI